MSHGSDSILPNRIGLWPLRLAGASKKPPCASMVLSHIMKDDLIGICSDVRASTADH